MEVRKTVINGREYRMLLPPVRPAMQLSTRVSALLGPLIASLGSKITSGGWGVFAQALQSLDPDKVDSVLMEASVISKLSYVELLLSEGNNFELHFGQYRGDLYQALVWCLWETVRDFFPQLEAFIQTMKEAGVVEKALESLYPKDGQ